jgi:GNAT superfamily N-acetyltransferase
MPAVRYATVEDARVVAQLLHDFNTEFDTPTPPVDELEGRLSTLLPGGDPVVLLGGDGPDGLAVLRFRPSIWSSGLECYLAELYVKPARRGRGLGRALMEAAIGEALGRGADWMDIGVDESLGFTTRSGGADGPLMFVYERDLRG